MCKIVFNHRVVSYNLSQNKNNILMNQWKPLKSSYDSPKEQSIIPEISKKLKKKRVINRINAMKFISHCQHNKYSVLQISQSPLISIYLHIKDKQIIWETKISTQNFSCSQNHSIGKEWRL